MFKFLKLSLFFYVLFLFGCNKDLTEEELEELWSKAQTSGEIVRRSGTPFNLATHRELALRDANTRLQTGGGLLKKGGGLSFGTDKNKSNQTIASVGMPINQYLWRASIETIDFMPLASADPFGGMIITEWYTSETNLNERCKLNIFINGAELKTNNLKVSSFCQVYKNENWVNISSNPENNNKLENAILNKAKKLKLSSG